MSFKMSVRGSYQEDVNIACDLWVPMENQRGFGTRGFFWLLWDTLPASQRTDTTDGSNMFGFDFIQSRPGCWQTFYIFAYCGLVGNPHSADTI